LIVPHGWDFHPAHISFRVDSSPTPFLIMITPRSVAVVLSLVLLATRSFAQTDEASRAEKANTSANETLAPKIEFAAPVLDFGKIIAGTVVNHAYEFKNTGNAPLILTEVQPSCGCTTSGGWPARLEPGQTGSIPIQFNSTGYGGRNIDEGIMVASNDPVQPSVALGLKGVVVAPIEVSPGSAVFLPPADAPSSESKVIRITNHTEHPLILSAPESDNRAFAVELTTVRPEQEFELRVTTLPPIGAKSVRGNIIIKTNSPQIPVLTVTTFLAPRRAKSVNEAVSPAPR
jgi:hypothetical protein